MSVKVTKKEINRQYQLFKKMIKENENYIKLDIENILNNSELNENGSYLVVKLALLMMAEGMMPLTTYTKHEFNKFLNRINC